MPVTTRPPADTEIPPQPAPTQPAKPQGRKLRRYKGTIYRFPADVSDQSIERWFNKEFAHERTLLSENAGGRSLSIDAEQHTAMRTHTPLSEQGVAEYAEFFSVKPEDVTPRALGATITERKQHAAELAKMSNVDPVALREYREDTATMERDLDRSWPNETSGERFARQLDKMKPEDIVDIAREGGYLKDSDTPETAREKLLEAHAKNRPEDRQVADEAILAQRPGYTPPPGWLESTRRGVLRTAQDIGVTAAKAAVALPQAATGLVDLVGSVTPLGALTKWAAKKAGLSQYASFGWLQEQVGIKYAETQQILHEGFSSETQQAYRNVAEAEGILGKLGAALKNPSVIFTSVGESIPQMLAGGAIGKTVQAVPKIGKYGYALGEGLISAGAGAEQTRAESESGVLTKEQEAIHLASGGLTTLIGILGAKVARLLGVDDVDVLLAGGASQKAQRNVLTRVVAGALIEGGVEETLQSAQEQIASNLANGKPWYEGWDESLVVGGLSGGLIGGAVQLRPRTSTLPPADRERLQALPDKLMAGGTVSRKDAAAWTRATGQDLPTDQAERTKVVRDAYGLTEKPKHAPPIRGPEEKVREEPGGEDVRGTGQGQVPTEPTSEEPPPRAEGEVPATQPLVRRPAAPQEPEAAPESPRFKPRISPKARETIGGYAAKHELDPGHLLQAAQESYGSRRDTHERRRDAKAYAHKAFNLPAVALAAMRKSKGTRDLDSIKRGDEKADMVIQQFPDLFAESEDPHEAVWELLNAPKIEQLRVDSPKVLEDAAAEVRSGLAAKSTYGASNKIVTQSEYEKEKDNILRAARGETLLAGIDPSLLKSAVKIGLYHLEAGTRSFAAWAAKMAEDFGHEVHQHLPQLWDRIGNRGDSAESITEEEVEAIAREIGVPQEQEGPVDIPVTSIKNEIVNDLRKRRDVDELEGVDKETTQEWIDAAADTLAHDPKTCERLVNELTRRPRNLDNREVAILQMYYRHLQNGFEGLSDQFFQAVKTGDSIRIARARDDIHDQTALLAKTEEATKAAGREWGRAGVARQIMLERDFSLAALVRRAQVANEGEPLSTEQHTEIAELARQVKDIEQQLAEEQARTAKLERQAKHKHVLKEDDTDAKRSRVQRKPKRKQQAENRTKVAWANFKEKWSALGQLGFAYDPKKEAEKFAQLVGAAREVVGAYIDQGYRAFAEFWAVAKSNLGKNADNVQRAFRQAWQDEYEAGNLARPALEPGDLAALSRVARMIQRNVVEAGVTDRDEVADIVHHALVEILPEDMAEISREDVIDALSKYGQFSPLSKDALDQIIRDINGQLLQVSKLNRLEEALRLTQQWKQEGLSDQEIVRRLEEQDLMLKATGPERREAGDLERRLIAEVNEMKKQVPIPDVQREGRLKTAQGAIETALRNRITDVLWEIEHQERIIRERRKTPDNETIVELRKELDELRVIHREMFPPTRKKMTEQQRIDAAIRAADRTIAQLENQLATGDIGPKAKPPPLSSPQLDARRARLAQLRAERDALRAAANPKMTAEERARRSYEGNLRKRIANYKQQLANEEFEPTPKKQPRKLSPRELNLKRQLEDVKHEFFEKLGEYRRKHMNPLQRAAYYAMETAHLSRALMTSFDLSAVFRQGGLAVYAHPVMARKAAEEMWKALWSRQAEFDSMEKIRNRPNGQLYETAKLDLTSTEAQLTRQEEVFMGRWARKTPGVAASARAYITFLNNLRADLFDQMVENLGRSGQVTLAEAKVIARFVNVATGRADLKALNTGAAHLNMIFFAPRYVASRFQYLAMPFYLPFTKTSARVKRAVAKEYARTFVGWASFTSAVVVLGSLLTDDDDEKPTVELNPLSADFLKIRFGDTRIDTAAGLSQVMVLSSRFIAGRRKSTVSGKVIPFGEGYKPSTRLTTLAAFARTKLAPVPGALATIWDDWTNVVGEKETPVSLTGQLFMPLAIREVAEAMKWQGLAKGTPMSVLGLLGMGMHTYGPKTEYLDASPEQRTKLFDNYLERMTWQDGLPAYSDYLTPAQMKEFHERQDRTRWNVVINATDSPPDKENYQTEKAHKKAVARYAETHEKAIEQFREFAPIYAPTYEDAEELFFAEYDTHGGFFGTKGYPKSPEAAARRTALKNLYQHKE